MEPNKRKMYQVLVSIGTALCGPKDTKLFTDGHLRMGKLERRINP